MRESARGRTKKDKSAKSSGEKMVEKGREEKREEGRG